MAAYTADAAREVIARVLVDQAAGAGDYIVYAKVQRGGSGSSYVMLPKTTGTAASGETAIGFVSISLPVSTGDVVTIWVDGLAGDTTTPDIITDWYEVDTLRPGTVDQTLTVDASGRVDVSKIEGTDATDALDARITAAGLATATALATAQTSLNTIAGYIDTEVAAILAAVDTEVAAIKAKTDNLPSDPADASDIAATLATLAGYTDTLEASATSLAAAIALVQGYTDQVEGYTDTLETAVAALPTAASINTVLSSAHGSGPWGGASGSGAITWAYTLTSTVSPFPPIADAEVWVTTDSGGTNIVASGTTNASGVVTFYLDAGTYYVWRRKSGWNFTNPDTEVVA